MNQKQHKRSILIVAWLLVSFSLLIMVVAMTSQTRARAASPASGSNCATPEATNYWCTSSSPNGSGSNVLRSCLETG